jgi:hypothetical protein
MGNVDTPMSTALLNITSFFLAEALLWATFHRIV